MAKQPRQRVLIQDVDDNDPANALPPLPPGFEEFTLPGPTPEDPSPPSAEATRPGPSTNDDGLGVGGDQSPGSGVDAPAAGVTVTLLDDTSDLAPYRPRVGSRSDDDEVSLVEAGIDGEIMPPEPETPAGKPRYEQRIRIVEAWQFVEGIAKSPAWVDKNWASWGDEDVLRGIPAGPSIKVPGPGGTMICRHGDYIARQLMTLLPGLPPEERIEVWPRESFERFFIRT